MRISVLLIGLALAACTTAPPTEPAPSPTANVRPTPAASGITREQAIEAARAAAPRYATADVLDAEMGRFADLVSAFTAAQFTQAPAPDRLVWRITLGEQPSPTGGQGTDVIIDFWDGRLIFATEWVS